MLLGLGRKPLYNQRVFGSLVMIKESKAIQGLFKFFFPIVVGLSTVGIVGFLLEESLRISYWGFISGYFFPPLGKESIIPAGVALGINPLVMGLSIAFVDIIVALFLVWNYDLAKKIPFIGTFMITIETKGKNVEERYGWIKPLRFIGIVLFVMIPFQGSGGLVGSIVGRLIGMKPRNTFYAIALGAIIGTLLIAAFSKAFLIFAKINTTLTLVLLASIVILVLIYYLYKRRKKIRS